MTQEQVGNLSPEGLARHSDTEQREHLVALIALLLLAVTPYFLMSRTAFQGSLHLHATIELIAALFGIFTGFALVLRFYSLGNRYHLLIGLAYFMTGCEDLIHGLFCFPGLFDVSQSLVEDLIPLTFVTGQFLMGLTLILALVLPSWVRAAKGPWHETIRGLLIVLLLTTIAAALLRLPVPPQSFSTRPLQPMDIVALVALATAFAGYLARYQRHREMLDWWITASLGVNAVGQFLMLASDGPFDAFFVVSHLYKVVGYMIPLIGFFLYQILVLLEYDRRGRDLLAAREEALAAARAKSEFLANMSHEIRTPMNGVLGMTERAIKTAASEEQRETLVAVRDSATSLLDLLDDLLDFSKIEAGKFAIVFSDFYLRELLERTLLAFRTTAQDKGLFLKLNVDENVPDHIRSDERRLRQVIVNLVGNAIKFTLSGGVEVRAMRRARDVSSPDGAIAIEFAVVDTGIGIAPEKQKLIFEAFSQADGSTTRRFGGTGLGLAISEQLVELMGGRLSVESKEGEGSTFRFWIQAEELVETEPRSNEVAASPVLALHASRPARILLAEDNEINRKVASGMLEDMGHEVLVAHNGKFAVEILERERVDLALVDVQMPEMGGLEVAAWVRSKEQGQDHLPIVALTAHAMPEDREWCLKAGCDDYLAKPVHAPALFGILERLLSEHPGTASIQPAEETPIGNTSVEEPFNADRLLQHVQGNRQLIRELLALFEQQAPELLADLTNAIRDRNATDAARVAHKLAGSASNFHCERLVECARGASVASSRGDWSSAEKYGHDAERACKTLLAALRQFVDQPILFTKAGK